MIFPQDAKEVNATEFLKLIYSDECPIGPLVIKPTKFEMISLLPELGEALMSGVGGFVPGARKVSPYFNFENCRIPIEGLKEFTKAWQNPNCPIDVHVSFHGAIMEKEHFLCIAEALRLPCQGWLTIDLSNTCGDLIENKRKGLYVNNLAAKLFSAMRDLLESNCCAKKLNLDLSNCWADHSFDDIYLTNFLAAAFNSKTHSLNLKLCGNSINIKKFPPLENFTKQIGEYLAIDLSDNNLDDDCISVLFNYLNQLSDWKGLQLKLAKDRYEQINNPPLPPLYSTDVLEGFNEYLNTHPEKQRLEREKKANETKLPSEPKKEEINNHPQAEPVLVKNKKTSCLSMGSFFKKLIPQSKPKKNCPSSNSYGNGRG